METTWLNKKMSNSKLSLTFKPATLCPGKDWHVQFYVLDPANDKLVRKKIRLNNIKSLTERKKYGLRLAREINDRLYAGWNPFLEQSAPNGFQMLIPTLDRFISAKEKELRPDSLRSYRSFLNRFKEWLVQSGEQDVYVISFKENKASQYLNELYRDPKISNKTYNNYLIFMRALWNWMVENQYAVSNVFDGFSKKKEEVKQRTPVPVDVRDKIKEYLEEEDKNFLIVCMLVFQSLLRPKEISMLKPENFQLKNQVICVPSAVAKNRNERFATIPDALMPYLLSWDFNKAKNDQYIFSKDLLPGDVPINARRWSKKWDAMRIKLGLPKEMMLYSLRDSGIISMLQNGVSPEEVMIQADHHSLEMTTRYLRHAMPKGVDSIKQQRKSF